MILIVLLGRIQYVCIVWSILCAILVVRVGFVVRGRKRELRITNQSLLGSAVVPCPSTYVRSLSVMDGHMRTVDTCGYIPTILLLAYIHVLIEFGESDSIDHGLLQIQGEYHRFRGIVLVL